MKQLNTGKPGQGSGQAAQAATPARTGAAVAAGSGGYGPINAAQAWATLERTLDGLLAAHEAQIALLDHHRAALRSADAGRLSECVAAQQQAARAIATLEAERLAAVRMLTQGQTPEPPLGRLIERAPAAMKPRLSGLRERLGPVLRAASQRQAALTQAAQTMSTHLHALLTQVSRALSPTGTYAPVRGVARGTSIGGVAAAIDLTS